MTLHKLLVANRGEIAIRILRAAAEVGVRGVAVFSEDDGRCLHVAKADELWPETGANGHRYQSLKRFVSKVPWYKNGREVHDEWQAAHPGETINYDPGGVFENLFVKYPGWRAREGHGQPALGIPGIDPCPPACAGAVSQGYQGMR